MLEKRKLTLRITHTALDSEISSNIETALLEMSRVGINTSIDDALVYKCVEFYCKWQADYLGKAEIWQKSFENLRDAMSLCGDYQ